MHFELTLKPTSVYDGRECVPQVRLPKEHLEALKARAQVPGVHIADALRQLIAHYVEHPFPLQTEKTRPVGKHGSGSTGKFFMDAATLRRFEALIGEQGVKFPNAVRQLVAQFVGAQ